MKRRAIKTAVSAVKVADCLICIDGLPAAVTAFAWATEMARKLKQSITVRTPAGEPIGTIDKAFLTGTKAELAAARRATKTANAVEPKAPKEKATARTGKRLEVDHPDIPLHTNGSENDIRCQVTKRQVSGGTKTDIGRDCRDAFLGLAKTTKKLCVSFWDYLGARLGVAGAPVVPPLPELIRCRAQPA